MGTANWNDIGLKPPPTFTCKLSTSDVSTLSLRKLSDVLWDALTVLQNQQALSTEAATLSRLIYRMKSLFRGDKGFKTVEKVNHCLRHYLSLNLVPMYDTFFRTIPWESSDNEIYCPTRQMLEHILLRTQGLAALLCRIVHTCLEGAFLFKSRMSSGHHWHVSLLCLGAISRIWAIAKHLFASCVRWYSTMLPFLDVLKPNGPAFLPEGHAFPKDLTSWLDVTWMDKPVSFSDSNLSNSHETDEQDEKEEREPWSAMNHLNSRIQSIHDDVGVSISRNTQPAPPTGAEKHAVNSNEEGEILEGKEIIHLEQQETASQKRRKASSKSKVKKRKMNASNVNQETETDKHIGCENPGTDIDFGTELHISEVIEDKVKQTPKKKSKNISKVLSAIKSQRDVERILNSEAQNRSLTSALDDKQWALLRNLVNKLNLKLKKTQEEKKQQKFLDQIRKAFKIALS